jgi:hypothetical protein
LQGFAAFTGDLLITSQLLYQLSYTGSTKVYYSGSNGDVNLILPVTPIIRFSYQLSDFKKQSAALGNIAFSGIVNPRRLIFYVCCPYS